MATNTRVSILLLSALLVILSATPAWGTRTIWHKQRECLRWKRELTHLKKELELVKVECPKQQLWYYQKAKNTHGCEFSPRNGLRAVYEMKKICWNAKSSSHKYYRACNWKSWACKQALNYVKRADGMKCNKKITKLSWLLQVAEKKYHDVKYFCEPKPSNAPRTPGRGGRRNRW